ncbi:MAG TPA: DNA-3-methyladenine glycosylase I [Actinomycetota bacterium]|nr:DNA-3-methyladenine glycosylase I [Actinomycetota bacterium]
MDPSDLGSGVVVGDDGIARCWWCVEDELYRRYHDVEWGRPVADDRQIFEKLSLEGFQSGLSWLTILRKRDNFRKAFRSFDMRAVAKFDLKTRNRLLLDAGIVRNRAKIDATINNARRCLELIEEFGSLAAYVWSFEPKGRSRSGSLDWKTLVQMGPSEEARAMSRDLKRRGWAFVGPTTVYSAMESIGMVNDHLTGCEVRNDVERERSAFRRPVPRGPLSVTGPRRSTRGASAGAASSARRRPSESRRPRRA